VWAGPHDSWGQPGLLNLKRPLGLGFCRVYLGEIWCASWLQQLAFLNWHARTAWAQEWSVQAGRAVQRAVQRPGPDGLVSSPSQSVGGWVGGWVRQASLLPCTLSIPLQPVVLVVLGIVSIDLGLHAQARPKSDPQHAHGLPGSHQRLHLSRVPAHAPQASRVTVRAQTLTWVTTGNAPALGLSSHIVSPAKSNSTLQLSTNQKYSHPRCRRMAVPRTCTNKPTTAHSQREKLVSIVASTPQHTLYATIWQESFMFSRSPPTPPPPPPSHHLHPELLLALGGVVVDGEGVKDRGLRAGPLDWRAVGAHNGCGAVVGEGVGAVGADGAPAPAEGLGWGGGCRQSR
jgi:hypothetical protein